MNTKNKFHLFCWLFMGLLLLNSCENDGDKIYLSTPESAELIVSENHLKLIPETKSQLVLSFAWSKTTVAISNPDMSATDVLITTLQASTSEDFTSNVYETSVSNLSKAFTGAELNTVARQVGIEPETEQTVYFRLGLKTGTNIPPTYSNVVTVAITPYIIDMTIGFILDENRNSTDMTLYSPEENGIYTGFMGTIKGWYNFFMQEGDGTIWGSNSTIFKMISQDAAGESFWNLWFPAPTGCYYVVLDTPANIWTALYLPELTISGDLSGSMNYNRSANKWTYENTLAAGTYNIRLSSTAQQFNVNTGGEAEDGIDSPVGFVQNGENLELASEAGVISITIPATDEYTITVDLSNPAAWTCTVKSGIDEEEEEAPDYLYLPGIDDGYTGMDWNFNYFLPLTDGNNWTYSGIFYINSKYGYNIYTEASWGGEKYTTDGSGDALQGKLTQQSPDNIPAPTVGTYIMDVSLKGLTYKLTEVDFFYVVGVDSNWGFKEEHTIRATDTPGEFSGTIEIAGGGTDGFRIYPIKDNWTYYLGGGENQIHYLGENVKDEFDMNPGTYTLTINLLDMSYSIQ